MSKKALVLSSGGVDSTTCLSVAIAEFGRENVSTVSIYYGQKHRKELESAKKVADYYHVPHYELDLSAIFKYSNCSLLAHSTEKIVHESYAEQIARNGEGKVATYVPFRNGLMLSAVASLAMSIYEHDEVSIYIGAHADDAAGNAYADCSQAFTDAMGQAIAIGTYNQCHIVAPFVGINKAGVVKKGLELGTPYELTWSCYEGGDKPCGTCGTCIDRAKAFAANGVPDPALEGK
jgi:7-cyano-7-deazaguanine synthase